MVTVIFFEQFSYLGFVLPLYTHLFWILRGHSGNHAAKFGNIQVFFSE